MRGGTLHELDTNAYAVYQTKQTKTKTISNFTC